ncbi:hypothetical protein BHM03_00054684 [Ensete ventricosum]|nr:hypothetical protein BHM03_00054684 [Ensete ventricosum]
MASCAGPTSALQWPHIIEASRQPTPWKKRSLQINRLPTQSPSTRERVPQKTRSSSIHAATPRLSSSSNLTYLPGVWIGTMAVDLMGYRKIDDQIAIQEAAAAGIRSMEHLVLRLSDHQQQQPDCREIADLAVSKFKKVISILNRTGHARFRRGPTGPPPPGRPSLPAASKTLTLAAVPLRVKPPDHPLPLPTPQALTLDFTKPIFATAASEVSPPSRYNKGCFSISKSLSAATSSFVSSVTGDGSVSNGRLGTSSLLLPQPVAVGKPPLSSALHQRGHEHTHAHSDHIAGKYAVPGSRCHCSKKR